MAERLAPGLLSFDGKASTPHAVDLLMQAVLKRFPEAIREFSEQVSYPAATLEKRVPRRGTGLNLVLVPSPALQAWCLRWNLNSESIHAWAFHTVMAWEDDPESRAALRWKTAPAFYSPLVGHTSENPDEPLAPVGARPNKEEWPEFCDRVARHWEARVAFFKDHDFADAPLKTNAEHFDWFARFQCGGENLTMIAESVGRDVTTVSEAVASIAKHLRLARRPRVKSGRPRKSENRKV